VIDGVIQHFRIIPGHPLRRRAGYVICVFLNCGEIVEWVGLTQLASMNETHEQVSRLRSIHRLIEQRIFAMQNRTLQCAFAKIVIKRRIGPEQDALNDH